jgi:hypothetical protein
MLLVHDVLYIIARLICVEIFSVRLKTAPMSSFQDSVQIGIFKLQFRAAAKLLARNQQLSLCGE